MLRIQIEFCTGLKPQTSLFFHRIFNLMKASIPFTLKMFN